MTPERVTRLDEVLAQRQPDLTVFAENLHKPKNFSAMVRNCDAVGINEMHVSPGEEDIRKHWKTSQGAEKWMYIKAHDNTEDACQHLKSRGFQLVAAHLSVMSSWKRSSRSLRANHAKRWASTSNTI